VPLFIAALKLGPGLLAGCTFVLKPSPETPLDSYPLAEAIIEAGFPEGVINIIPAGRETGEYIVKHPDVDKISFTGSTAAGMRIGELCGGQLKRCTLELGGKSPRSCSTARTSTRRCRRARAERRDEQRPGMRRTEPHPRVAKRYSEVVDALGERSALKVGDPLDDSTRSAARRRAPAPRGGLHRRREGRARGRHRWRSSRGSLDRAGTSSPRCSPTSTTR
jgi:hypothetical protein